MKPEDILVFIRQLFAQPEGNIYLHEPYFGGNEKKYLMETIDSTFVSSTGEFVNRFEKMMSDITGARYAIATVNGTTALHLSLLLAGVNFNDEVITQPLTFVATANSIVHAGAEPIFLDVDRDTMGLSPASLRTFLQEFAIVNKSGKCMNKRTGKRIAACLPMHSFGLPLRIVEIAEICAEYNIPLVEDSAESLGSFFQGKHTGTFGLLGTFSLNGNKTVTCGGGGAIITDDEMVAKKAKHLSTTAKIPHDWDFVHDFVAYNYRMPNLNAAVACAQLEQLQNFVQNKRKLAASYADFFKGSDITFVREIDQAESNYWLNTVIFPNHEKQLAFLNASHENKILTRPAWKLMNTLAMFTNCQTDSLSNAQWLQERIVNLPSSVRLSLNTESVL